MATRAFLDSNVFLFGFELPTSNSHRILELLSTGDVRGVVTDWILREALGYIRRRYGKDVAGKYRDFILLTCDLVLEADVPISKEHAALVGAKDAGALAAARALGISRIVSTDSDFALVPERRTPPEFLREMGRRTRAGDV